MFRTLALVVLLCLLPTAARAGTVTRDSAAITYSAAPAEPGVVAPERVEVGLDSGIAFVESQLGVDTTDCTETEPTRAECAPAPGFVVLLLGFDDTVSAAAAIGSMTMEVHGGGGFDGISGTPGNDRLFGDAGRDAVMGLAGDDLVEGGPDNDSLHGDAGNDTLRGAAGDDHLSGADGSDSLDGGEGQDSVADGPGDDAVDSGPENDLLIPGAGRDTFDAGEGTDLVDYSGRTAAVTITLAGGGGDDGEAGEGDDLGTAVENARGGGGDDRIVGGDAANTLAGGSGNDEITGGGGEDRVEGGDGDDMIDTRDGGYDSVACGPGNDTVLSDPGDATNACETAPSADGDGDGHPGAVDCAPQDPAINPGAREVPGNAVDEDCKDGPLYLRVVSPVSYATAKTRRGLRFRAFRVNGLVSGDVVDLRCRGGRRRGCAFKTRRYGAGRGKKTINIVGAFKKRPLQRGATVEVRILRENFIGRVLRLKVGRRLRLADRSLCLFVGDRAPRACG